MGVKYGEHQWSDTVSSYHHYKHLPRCGPVAVVCRGMLWCVVVCYSVSWCVMVYRSVVWRVVVWSVMLQCVIECRGMLRCVVVYRGVVWWVAVCCGMLWCVVECCDVTCCSMESVAEKKRKHKQMFYSICPLRSIRVLLKYVETTCCSLEILHIRTK